MPLLTALSAAGTAYSLGKQLFGKQKSFADTAYGRKLKELSQKGIDTQPIIGEIGGNLANISQQEKTALKGRLISQGMGGSIAGQRAISEIDTKRMDKLQKAIKDIQMKNEQLKTQYGLQYAQAGTEYDTAQQQQESDALSDLLGVSGSILYDQLSPQKDLGQMLASQTTGSNNPYRPDVPIEAPPDTVMPPDYTPPKAPDLPIPIKPTGMETSPLSNDFMRTNRLYGGYNMTNFDDYVKYLRYLDQRRRK